MLLGNPLRTNWGLFVLKLTASFSSRWGETEKGETGPQELTLSPDLEAHQKL